MCVLREGECRNMEKDNHMLIFSAWVDVMPSDLPTDAQKVPCELPPSSARLDVERHLPLSKESNDSIEERVTSPT